MAAAIKALNARIRSNPVTDYICSTHFWGPMSNFGIPMAAIADAMYKDADIISGPMTLALSGYSGVFMRYSMAVTPKNYLLFACHFINFNSQMVQGYRYSNFHFFGGKEQALGDKVTPAGEKGIVDQAKDAATKAQEKAQEAAAKAQEKAQEGLDKVKGK